MGTPASSQVWQPNRVGLLDGDGQIVPACEAARNPPMLVLSFRTETIVRTLVAIKLVLVVAPPFDARQALPRQPAWCVPP